MNYNCYGLAITVMVDLQCQFRKECLMPYVKSCLEQVRRCKSKVISRVLGTYTEGIDDASSETSNVG